MTPVRFAALAALAALAVTLCAQPKDVDGWDKIKWGMTIAEARAAYGTDAKPESKDDWTLLQLNPVKMAAVEMSVEVGARQGAEKITSVRLWSYFGIPSAAPMAGPQDFDALKAFLTEKYGHPAKEDSRRGENFRLIKTVLWTFPSTSILMTLEQSASLPNLGYIDVDYSATGQ